MPRKTTDLLIVHCSATPPSMDIGRAEIDRWHRERGFLGIGYHFVIRRDGTVETGRDLEDAGAHAKGYNNRSVGICLVGGIAEFPPKAVRQADPRWKTKPEANFTEAQYAALEGLLKELEVTYPGAEIIGHRDVNPHKACPCFDAKQWAKDMGL